MNQVLFENCALLDVNGGNVLPAHHVLVENDRIVEVSDRPIHANDALKLNIDGRVLMPGLIDAHVHSTLTTMDLGVMVRKPITLVMHEARQILEGMLARGFTTVRDAAGADFGLAQAVENGLIDGPRIFYVGRGLSQTGGHGDWRPLEYDPQLCSCSINTSWFFHVADGVDAVRKAAREELRRGAHAIKIMGSGGVASPTDPIWNLQYSDEELRAIVWEAESWRTYAIAHAYTPEAISRAVEAGVRTIEHGNLIDLPTARLMADRNAYLVPTLVTYSAIEEFGQSLNFPEVSQRKVRDVLEAGLTSLKISREAGVKLGFGTDLLGELHDRQSQEFLIRSEVFPPLEVIQSATITNAEILNMQGELGVISPRALADILIVDGNPLEDISLLTEQGKHLSVIMKDGEFVINRLA